jgi:GcrA cell cycle regulator
MSECWTDEKVDALRMLWSKGHTTSSIGAALYVTRNAVIGKAHRLGLPARRSGRKRAPSKWTPEMCALLVKMRRDGASLKQLAEIFDTHYSVCCRIERAA